MTIDEWIDRGRRPVPTALRPVLRSGGEASVDAFLKAAESEASRSVAGAPRDRDAAFALLGADAYITYACLWAVQNSGASQDLRRMTRRVAGAPWRE